MYLLRLTVKFVGKDGLRNQKFQKGLSKMTHQSKRPSVCTRPFEGSLPLLESKLNLTR
jgi:hypothetical protein